MAKKETKRGGDAVPESTTKKKSRSFPTVTPSKKKGRKGPPTVKPKKKKSSSATSVKGGEPEAVSKDTEKTRDIKDTPYATFGMANDRQYVLSNRLGGSVDPLMQAMSRFWTSNENSLIFSIEDVPFKLESKRSPHSESVTGQQFETLKAIPDVFDTGIGDISMEAGNIDSLRKTSEFFEALNTIQYSAALPTYEVYNFTQRCPIQYPSYHDNNSVVNADVSFIYNYELKNYEELTSPASFNETQCLNFYIDYEKIADAYVRTLSDLRTTSKAPTAYTGHRAKPVLSKNSRSQFDKELQSETAGNGGAENVIISDEMLEKMRARNEALGAGKISLPFYVKIDIDKTIEPPDNITDVNEIIFEDGSIFVDIATYCADITSPTSKADYSSRKSFTNSNWTATYGNEEQTETELSFGLQSNNLNLIDALAMSTNLIDNRAASSSPPTKQIYAPAPIKEAPTYTGTKTGVTGYTSTSTPSTSTTSTPPTKATVINYTGLEDLHDELESMLKMEEFHYYYSDLLANASRPSTEIIMYRIAKYESENSLLPIQNIWLPRKDDKKLSYIDFQVKYGKRYVYKIFAYKFIVGTTYSLTVSRPTDNSYFGKIVEDYYEVRNTITATAMSKKTTLKETVDDAIGLLLEDIADIIDDPKNRLSNAKEPLGSTRSESASLRVALRALMIWLQGKEWDSAYDKDEDDFSGFITTSTFDKVQRKIEEDISGIVASSSTGGYITADVSGVDTDTKAELQSILDIMNEFEDMGDSLITTLRNILSSKEGLHDGTSKKNQLLRQSAANVLKSTIELFLDKEEEMIDALLGVTSNEVKKGFIEGTKIITAVTYPHIDLVEFPYYSDAGTILDNPPVFPDVNFVPYKGVDNKIGLFLNSGIGLDILKPINISPQDQAYIDLFREARKYNGLEPIAFKSDESKNMAATFEIYRLKMAPNSYADFENIGVHAVVAEKFKGGLESLPSVSYMDNIHPNQAYYYMFRSIDERGNRSNPSQVFSLTMVNENGLVFPLINHYEFPPPPTNYTKQFKKLLNLAPSINQVSFEGSEVASYDVYKDKNNINGLLGVNKQGIFGKTFKIRVTSKKTGKQLDLNITFDSQIE